MAIEYHYIDVNYPKFRRKKVGEIINQLLVKENLTLGEVSVIFCTDKYLLEMNIEHLNHNYFTDIITFDYCEDNVISGDIFISHDRVKENAKAYKVRQELEFVRVIGHGFLHLLGLKDKTEEESLEMRANENLLIKMYLD